MAVARLVAPLRGRDFRLVWVGQTTSAFGNALQLLALSWLILDSTGSPVDLSITLLVPALTGSLTTLMGGVLADRMDPRRIMAISDVIRAACMGMLGYMVLMNSFSLDATYGIMAVFGAAGGFFGPAAGSIVPRVVPARHIQAASSLTQASPQLGTVLGAPTAGFLIAFIGTAGVILFNAVTFVLSAVLILLISAPREVRIPSGESLVKTARDGARFVLHERWIVALLVLDSILALSAIGPMSIGLPVLARSTGEGSSGLGLMFSGFAVGCLLGMVYSGTRQLSRRCGVQFCVINAAQGLLFLVVAAGTLPVRVIAIAVLGLLNGVTVVIYLSIIQQAVPKHFMGRVMGLVGLCGIGLTPLSQAITGVLASSVGAVALFVLAGGVMVTTSLVGLLSAPLRSMGSMQALGDPSGVAASGPGAHLGNGDSIPSDTRGGAR